jgi:hypothetical protein
MRICRSEVRSRPITLDIPLRRAIAVLAMVSLTVPSAFAVESSGQAASPWRLNRGISKSAQVAGSQNVSQARSPGPIMAVFQAGQTPAKSEAPAAKATTQSQPSQQDQQSHPTKPLGTAAAPSESTAGIAASRPAGAVIAPAKQRRVRAIAIKVGLLIGAGIAIGTVIALTHGSPSRP